MGKSKPIKAAEVVTTSTVLPEKGKVWITLFSDGKDHEVSTTLAKTLINKNAAKMKKLIVILFAMLSFGMAQAQTGKSMTFTPATNDSIVGAATKYCTLPSAITGQWTGSIEIFLDQSVVGTDSCWVTVEGSQNNSTWYVLNNLGTPMLYGTAAVRSGQYRVSTTAGDAAIMWNFANVLPPYVRIKVQKYVATSSIKITRASIYLKR